ncbi:MAG: hypothetical protein ACLS85_04975 [Coprobacillus cateniformis]
MNILIVEDILDTGKTLYNVKDALKRNANSKNCYDVREEEGRIIDMKADYVGFKFQMPLLLDMA